MKTLKSTKGWISRIWKVGHGPVTDLTTLRIKKDETYESLKNLVSKQFNIAMELFRLWVLVPRQNKTIRPDVPIIEDAATLGKTMEVLRGEIQVRFPEFRLYMETREVSSPQAWPAVGNASPKYNDPRKVLQ